jgi:hypothetical protein
MKSDILVLTKRADIPTLNLETPNLVARNMAYRLFDLGLICALFIVFG